MSTNTTKISKFALLASLVAGSGHTLALALPPTGMYTNNLAREEWSMGVNEYDWNANTNIELITGKDVRLTGDREVRGLKSNYQRNDVKRFLNLDGHRLVIGDGGILVNDVNPIRIVGGSLTSRSGQIKIQSFRNVNYLIPISSVISDYDRIKVGLDLINSGSNTIYLGAGLYGSQANTFTGDVNVVGRCKLDLYKNDGVVAVSGNLNLKDGGIVSIYHSGQISRHSRILLQSKSSAPSVLGLNTSHRQVIKEMFAMLVVDGAGVLTFDIDRSPESMHGIRDILLDDLDVMSGGYLLIKEWKEGRDHLLVRKDSEHVYDSLKRIEFENHDTRSVNLREYDAQYWEIYAKLPEPATYGAFLSVAGLSVWLYRKLRRRPAAA